MRIREFIVKNWKKKWKRDAKAGWQRNKNEFRCLDYKKNIVVTNYFFTLKETKYTRCKRGKKKKKKKKKPEENVYSYKYNYQALDISAQWIDVTLII